MRLNLKRYAERYHHHLLSEVELSKPAEEAKDDDEEDEKDTTNISGNSCETKSMIADDADKVQQQNQLDSLKNKIALTGVPGKVDSQINAESSQIKANKTTAASTGALSGKNKLPLASVFLLADSKQRHSQSFQVKPFRFELFQDENQQQQQQGSTVNESWILEKTIEFKMLTSHISVVNRNNNNNNTTDQFKEEPESVSLDVS